MIQLAMTNLRQVWRPHPDEAWLPGEIALSERNFGRLRMNGPDVSKVEIRLIDPPEDIKKAMHKQKTAARAPLDEALWQRVS